MVANTAAPVVTIAGLVERFRTDACLRATLERPLDREARIDGHMVLIELMMRVNSEYDALTTIEHELLQVASEDVAWRAMAFYAACQLPNVRHKRPLSTVIVDAAARVRSWVSW